MDPPYQGVCSTSDPRYYGGVEFDEFMQQLKTLNRRKIAYILSYDGRTGEKSYGQDLPAELDLHRIEIKAGRSTQSTLLGRSDITYESIYLSKALTDRLDIHVHEVVERYINQQRVQLTLI
jgi:DNA adenine methylase